MKKQIYQFHLDIVNKHIKELYTTGETIINSHFIYELFCKETKDATYYYTTEKIMKENHSRFTTNHRKFDYGVYHPYDYDTILRAIDNGHVRKEQILELYYELEWHYRDKVVRWDIDTLFTRDADKEEKMEILKNLYSDLKLGCSIFEQIKYYKFNYKISFL